MKDNQSGKRLGRGLAALIGDINVPESNEYEEISVLATSGKLLPIELLERNPRNPRRNFSESEIDDLAHSIQEYGVVQPVVVRPSLLRIGCFEIIAGERRWRAAQKAGLVEVPIVIRDVDDRTALEIAIVENIQRTDLDPVEEASGYQQLIEEHGYTQNDLARVIGKSRSHVANMLRLLKLPDAIQQLLCRGEISAGHARCLVMSDDPLGLALRIVEEGLSVRQTETIVNKKDEVGEKSSNRKTNKEQHEKDSNVIALEKILSEKLGVQVIIKPKNKGGDICIQYNSLHQLDDICQLLQG